LDPEDVNHQEIARSEKFKDSLDLLCNLGLSPYAIEYYLWPAYETGRLPHELLREKIDGRARDMQSESRSGSRRRRGHTQEQPATSTAGLGHDRCHHITGATTGHLGQRASNHVPGDSLGFLVDLGVDVNGHAVGAICILRNAGNQVISEDIAQPGRYVICRTRSALSLDGALYPSLLLRYRRTSASSRFGHSRRSWVWRARRRISARPRRADAPRATRVR